ncbi:MAG TPA: formate dehydrogenase subunit gamma [Casimicrobiaceae bacterium]|jgi:formate dehydrogenase subunit gamma
MMATFKFFLTAAIATLCIAAPLAVGQTQVYPVGPDLAKQQQERQQQQPLNNQPMWSEVRSGAPQTTTVVGRETNVLIQPEGQTWRALRTPLLAIGGWLVALALAGLAVFYAAVGALDYEKKPRERVIERFHPLDRYAHWLLAITWVTLAITGLILSLGKTVLLPLIGYTLFSWLAMASKALHNFVGPVLIVAIPFLFVRFIRDNGIGIDDFKWFINIMGYFKGHEYPSGKFNAGEKLVFWVVLVVLSTILVITGLLLVFPNFNQTRGTMQIANVIHVSAAYVAIALACVHIYLGTIGMTEAYRAMRYGYVTESWAKHHHLRWYEDVVAGRSREHFVDPEEAARAQGDPEGAMHRRTA